MKTGWYLLVYVAVSSTLAGAIGRKDVETVATYFLRLNGSTHKFELTEAEKEVVDAWKFSVLRLQNSLATDTDGKVAGTILRINSKSLAAFGQNLIDIVEVKSYTEGEGILFALRPDANGVIYRGQFVLLSVRARESKQLALIKAIYEAPDHQLSLEELAKRTGWATPDMNARKFIHQINYKTLMATGAPLLRLIQGHVRLELAEFDNTVSRPARVRTDRRNFKLTPLANRLFTSLHLEKTPLNSHLYLDRQNFTAVGLSLQKLLTATADINQAIGKVYGKPLIGRLSIVLMPPRTEGYPAFAFTFDALGGHRPTIYVRAVARVDATCDTVLHLVTNEPRELWHMENKKDL